ncbi:MAG: CapA family protein [Anaerohalosphaeraceae bacterium]|nr:CapA family protein [Anaerohalosphaeraceae bacterium]
MKVFITGDFCPDGKSRELLLCDEGIRQIFVDFAVVIAESDLAITNLECLLTNSEQAIKKIGPNLKCDPQIGKAIKKAGFDMVTLANNHVFDFGQEGLVETLKTLDGNQIAYTGAGLTLEQAQKTYYRDIQGKKLAIVNFAENEFNSATIEHGGSNPMSIIDRYRQIQQARKTADKVLVIIHGGLEHYHYPSPATVKRYRFFAEQGADAVVAHHTHCIGPCEVHNGVPIFYSLGNFLYDTPNHSKIWYDGYAVKLDLTDNGVEFEVYPYRQFAETDKIELLPESSNLYKQIEQLSEDIADSGKILTKWQELITNDSKQLTYLVNISNIWQITYRVLRRLGFFALLNLFFRSRQLRIVRHYLSCDAHREEAIEIIDKYLRDIERND